MDDHRDVDRHVIDQLSPYLDGDLKPGVADQVRGHLARCADCALAADQLRAIVASARSLDRPEPPPTLWPAIAGALAEPELPLPFLAWRRFFVRGFALGGFAGAAIVLLVIVGLRLAKEHAGSGGSPDGVAALADARREAETLDPLLQEAETELEQAAASYERSIDKLRSLLARMEEPRWSPEARSRFLESLARLDQAIERSRLAARSTPGDSAGNESLFAAYRSKIDFLAAAVHRGGPEEMFRERMP
jgi:hypothetical protein